MRRKPRSPPGLMVPPAFLLPDSHFLHHSCYLGQPLADLASEPGHGRMWTLYLVPAGECEYVVSESTHAKDLHAETQSEQTLVRAHYYWLFCS